MKFNELFSGLDYGLDWEKIKNNEEFQILSETPQSKRWHKEGDVLSHTIMVVKEMQECLKTENRCKNDKRLLIMSALCHDLGKAVTTKWSDEQGDYITSHHGLEGERIVRRLFYNEFPILREKLCYMVRYHTVLHHIFDEEDYEIRKKKMITLSHGIVPIKDMLLLNFCDSKGTINDNEDNSAKKEKFNRIKSFAEELDCYDKKYYFRNRYERIYFFNCNKERFIDSFPSSSKNCDEDTPFWLLFMIGVAGAGKDNYIEERIPDYPVLSRDKIRTEIGIDGEKPMGDKEQEQRVTEIFNERLIKYCKERKDVIINNTNLLKKYRSKFMELILPYRPYIIFVYVEPPKMEDCVERRKGQIDENIIKRMWKQMEFPNATECDELIFHKQENNNRFGFNYYLDSSQLPTS